VCIAGTAFLPGRKYKSTKEGDYQLKLLFEYTCSGEGACGAGKEGPKNLGKEQFQAKAPVFANTSKLYN
jgi:hypothetical protein